MMSSLPPSEAPRARVAAAKATLALVVRRRAAERAHRISDRYADDPPDERRPPSKRLTKLTKLTRLPADRDDADALLSDRLSRLLLRVERQAERRFERKLGKLQA